MIVQNWWSGAYQVERACDCAKGNRSAECAPGWHMVDSPDSIEAARLDAQTCRQEFGVRYRVVEAKTGKEV